MNPYFLATAATRIINKTLLFHSHNRIEQNPSWTARLLQNDN